MLGVFGRTILENIFLKGFGNYKYSAYGKRTVLEADGSTEKAKSSYGQIRGFTGYSLDEETGIYYAKVRMYSPGLGRFVGRDILGYKDGYGLYAAHYMPNDIDPSGYTIYSRCPLDDVIMKEAPSFEEIGGIGVYKYGYALESQPDQSGGRKEIVNKMLAEPYAFYISGDAIKSCRENFESHINARISVVNTALSNQMGFGFDTSGNPILNSPNGPPPDVVTDPSGFYNAVNNSGSSSGCQYACGLAMVVGIGPGGRGIERTKIMSIPGDWGRINNDNDVHEPGEEGENLIYIGNDKWLGHPPLQHTWEDWLGIVTGFSNGTGRPSERPLIFPGNGLDN